jgi:hypothetical protein
MIEPTNVAKLRAELAQDGFCRVPGSACTFSTSTAWNELLARLQLCMHTGASGAHARTFVPFRAATFGIATTLAVEDLSGPLFHLVSAADSFFPGLVDVQLFQQAASGHRTFHAGGAWAGETPVPPEFDALQAWAAPGRVGDVDLVRVFYEWDAVRARHVMCVGGCGGDAAFWALPGAVVPPTCEAEWSALASHFPGSQHAMLWGLYASKLGTPTEREALLQLARALLGAGGVVDAFQPRWGRTFNEYFPITFPVAQESRDMFHAQPCSFTGSTDRQNWHCDYQSTDRHDFAAGTDHGLVAVVLLTDCEPGVGGGTLLVPGSHHWVREYLRWRGACLHSELVEHFDRQLSAHFNSPSSVGYITGSVRINDHFCAPPLLLPDSLPQANESVSGNGSALVVGQIHGKAGDVWLMHPWLLHTGSRNVGGRVRAITNFTLKMDRAVPL